MVPKELIDCRVEFISHASLRVCSGGATLLTDPWYVDPIDCNATFHWPPVRHDVKQLAAETDAIWISHVHPDHLDHRTLAHFPKTVPVFIGDYSKKVFRDRLRELGFTVHEVPFQTKFRIPDTDFTISLLESDYGDAAAYDSSIVVQTPDFTVFDNNDCYLEPGKYDWVAGNFSIDYAFLGYSPASFFPICFEFEEGRKKELLHQSSERRYRDFLEAAARLNPRFSVPFAMGIRFLHPSMLWQNVEFNRPQEAVRRLRASGRNGDVLWPGDRIRTDGTLERMGRSWTEIEEDQALLKHAETLRKDIENIWDSEPPAREGLIDAFRRYVETLWASLRNKFPSVADYVIAYRIEGPLGGEFHFDFSRDPDRIFAPGLPAEFDMRYTYPDKLLQLRLDGKIDWDEVHFSNRVSIKQNRYAAKYYALLRSEETSHQTQGPS